MKPQQDDPFGPVLPGPGASDYERYLRTDELLALQKRPEEMAHHDELLFQTVHQSSELWLKHATYEVATATTAMMERDLSGAIRLLRRAVLGVRFVIDQLQMLEQMSPWEYQEVRRVLGHGSGFDSPGFRSVRDVAPPLKHAFDELLEEQGLTVFDLYREGRRFEDLYQLAELLIDWDERVGIWRYHHLKVVERIIGGDVIGTQGTPVEMLGRLVGNKHFPDLWKVRTTLTESAKEEEDGA